MKKVIWIGCAILVLGELAVALVAGAIVGCQDADEDDAP